MSGEGGGKRAADGSNEALRASEAYLDRIFGEGAGARHTRFIDKLGSPGLREALHRYHAIEADTSQLSLEENYLMAVVVLCALRHHAPAAMFAKTLRHLGASSQKIVEAVGRLEMWIGAIAAAESMAHVQRALAEWDEKGFASMRAWFPEEPSGE